MPSRPLATGRPFKVRTGLPAWLACYSTPWVCSCSCTSKKQPSATHSTLSAPAPRWGWRCSAHAPAAGSAGRLVQAKDVQFHKQQQHRTGQVDLAAWHQPWTAAAVERELGRRPRRRHGRGSADLSHMGASISEARSSRCCSWAAVLAGQAWPEMRAARPGALTRDHVPERLHLCLQGLQLLHCSLKFFAPGLNLRSHICKRQRRGSSGRLKPCCGCGMQAGRSTVPPARRGCLPGYAGLGRLGAQVMPMGPALQKSILDGHGDGKAQAASPRSRPLNSPSSVSSTSTARSNTTLACEEQSQSYESVNWFRQGYRIDPAIRTAPPSWLFKPCRPSPAPN